MKVFDKATIEGFAYGVDSDITEKALSELSFIIYNIIEDLKKNNPFLNGDYEILPVNEFLSGAVTPNSTLDILLILNSTQIEMNSIKLTKNKWLNIKNRLKSAFKSQKRRKSKRKRKKEKYLKSQDNIVLTANEKENYNISSFHKDLFNKLVDFVSNTNIVKFKNGVIILEGEDFPFTVQIFSVINKHGSYNYYLPHSNKFKNIDFNQRFSNLTNLLDGQNRALEMLRIYNSIYYNIFKKSANALLLESLLFNMPEFIFEKENVYDSYIASLNYLNNKKLSLLVSICDKHKKLFDEELLQKEMQNLFLFIKELKKYS